jgi:DNA invertase Pin-like site-specific DNA recombinase/peptidoglycan hydrolase-like protein with peptidoglycan-binding domain
MTTHLFAPSDRATTIATVAVLTVTAVLIPAAVPARDQSGRAKSVLVPGVGVAAKPSAQVGAVQHALQRHGYDLGRAGIDGRFGPLTEAGVRHLQADHGLCVIAAQSGVRATAASAQRRTKASEPTTELAALSSTWLHSIVGGALGVLAIVAAVPMVGFMRRRRARRAHATEAEPARRETAMADRSSAPVFDGSAVRAIDQAESKPPTPPSIGADERLESALPAGTPVIGYVTVPNGEDSNGANGAWAEIEATCERCSWQLLEIVREHGLERPGLGYALKRIANGDARALVVADLRRMNSSITKLGALMAWFNEADATLISLDPLIDTSTAWGQAVATTVIGLSRSEGAETGGRSDSGPRPNRISGRSGGRPAVADRPELVERIVAMRESNMTLQAIADQLNADGVPTVRGGARWRPSSIQAILGYRRPGSLDHLPPIGRRERR